MKRLLITVFAAVCVTALAPAALAYPWPLVPFDQQHPVRGHFDDPRLVGAPDGGRTASFHFGIDISAEDGTWVYAVAPGRAIVRGNTVRVRSPVRGGYREFGYWHIWPSVDTGDTIRLQQPIGQIAPGYGHVHFAETKLQTYLNPLRPNALKPYSDTTQPIVEAVTFAGERGLQSPQAVTGAIDLLVAAYDIPPVALPAPWEGSRLSPAVIQWRITREGVEVVPWTIAVDFRATRPPAWYFAQVYGPATRQNKARRPGNYVYYLAHAWDSRVVPNGAYVLEVSAADTRRNAGTAAVPFTVSNPSSYME